ncbi:MAG: hypothetical protein ACK46X_20940, partial [Candidatus Sericytochromatia bacterium]
MRNWIGGLLGLVAIAHAGAAGAADLQTFKRPEVERAIARLTQEAIWAHTTGRPANRTARTARTARRARHAPGTARPSALLLKLVARLAGWMQAWWQ